jgi:membrane protease subunit HflC
MKFKNLLNLSIGIFVALILAAYMITYQVRYDEVAVLTRFDSAVDPAKDASGKILVDADGYASDPGSLKDKPGLKFKMPWPIDKVYTYPKKIQLLDDLNEEHVTADGYSVIVRTYVEWKIVDPSAFFKSLKTIENAQAALQPQLRNLRGIISSYRFDQLVNIDGSKLKLEEIEGQSLEQLNKQLAKTNYGIEAIGLGIRRVVFPQGTTSKVFERMKEERLRMAQNSRSSGDSQAIAIRSEASLARDTILRFADYQASKMRAIGDNEAAKVYQKFQQDQEFAIFLRQIDAMKKILARNTTFILDADKISPLDMFVNEPGVAKPADKK